MAILTQTFITQSLVGLGDIVDINQSLTGTINAIPVVGGTGVLAGYYLGIQISAEDSCFFATVNAPASLPPQANPPFPPVWPYLFSTSNIYGRDHLSTNLKMIRGDTYIFSIAVILNGVAVDLTGSSLKMTAKWDITDSEANAVFVKSSPSTGIIITDAPGGLATITLASADTNVLPLHIVNLNYDIQLTDATGNIFTVLYGNLSVYPDVTTT